MAARARNGGSLRDDLELTTEFNAGALRAVLLQAQATNELDEHLYSHGVFDVEPGWRQTSAGIACVDVVRDSTSGSRNES